MMFALVALGLVALAGIADLATEAIEETADELEDRFNDLRDDPRVVDLLSSGTIPDSFSDDDTIERIAELSQNIRDDTGETLEELPPFTEADIFQVSAASNGIVRGFEVGADQLRIDAGTVISETEDPPTVLWHSAEDGIELHYMGEQETDISSDSFAVLLEGLTTPPPAEDITVTMFDEAEDQMAEFSGDQINLVQVLDTGEGDDDVELTDVFPAYDVTTGGGDDTVISDGLHISADLGAGDDAYTSNAETGAVDQGTEPQETVLGGPGNDVIRAGESTFFANGGAGDDTLFAEQIDVLAGALARLEGDAGKDVFTFSEGAIVSGGEDQDVFTFRPMLRETSDLSVITDFDPSEDALVIRLGNDYEGPGVTTISPALDGDGTLVEIDGQAALLLSQPVVDLSSIIVLQ